MNTEHIDPNDYANQFSDSEFWKKVKLILTRASRDLLEAALKLYFAAMDSDTPNWVKGVMFGALGYLILPIDLIADFIPVVGLSDDLAVLVAAVASASAHIKSEHIERAKQILDEWLG